MKNAAMAWSTIVGAGLKPEFVTEPNDEAVYAVRS